MQCPNNDETDDFTEKHPHWGMHYALPGLADKEQTTLLNGLNQAAKVEARPKLPMQALNEIEKSERFFNQGGGKPMLVARYLFEYMDIGHIHFANHAANDFFKLVGSKTPSEQIMATILIPSYTF